ncbi:MAG: hypothetical protein RRB22_01185 [Gammaproteobacteria bacterium]|nr:hypothetical protein [Gammaproteobacteria bacterium]
MKKYNTMTVQELEDENARLMQAKAEIREQQKELVAVLDAKRADAALAEDVKKLQEKHGAKLQVLNPGGIASAEGVNGE